MTAKVPLPPKKRSCLKGIFVRLLILLAAAFFIFSLSPIVKDAFFPNNIPVVEEWAVLETPKIDPVREDLPLATIYFTDPYGVMDVDPGKAVADAIDAAQERVEIAMYNLTLENVVDALLRAHQRGVEVQVVLDSNTINKSQPQRLVEGGIAVRSDNRSESMHNKFIIIDQDEVWTGSLNLSWGGNYNDHNNIVRLVDNKINQNYHTEFVEMFEDGFFGSGSPPNTPYPLIVLDGALVEVYFSPEDGVLDHALSLVAEAQQTIDFLAYSFTSDPLSEAMLERAKNGVHVRGVFDADQSVSNTGGEFAHLKQAGLDVRQDALSGLMHHKVIIVDGQAVLFGSYNFSNNAEYTNDENVIIYYEPGFAMQFGEEFERIYARSQQ